MKVSISKVIGVLLLASWSLIAQGDPGSTYIYFFEDHTIKALNTNTAEISTVFILPEYRNGSISPANDNFVYLAESATFADEIAAECPCGGELPADLVLVDLETGEPTLIAGQPEGSTLSTGITRSLPVWSPDGTMLAWGEGLEETTLVIYDITTGETTYAPETIPPQTLVSSTGVVTTWSQSGILVHTVDFGEDLTQNIIGLRVYQPDGSLTLDIPPQFDAPDEYTFVRVGDSDVIGIQQYDYSWVFLDSTTGEPITIETGRMATFAVIAPESSLRMDTPIIHEENQPRSYQILDASNNMVGTILGSAYLTPFGDGLIQRSLTQNSTWTLWRDANTSIDFLIESESVIAFFFVPTQRVIIPTDTPLVSRATCEGGILDIRLRATGYILGTTPNNVRAQPDTSAEITGQLAPGEWFQAMSGHVCADGISWWHISAPGVSGWTAEGVGDEYFIQPGCPEGGCTRG